MRAPSSLRDGSRLPAPGSQRKHAHSSQEPSAERRAPRRGTPMPWLKPAVFTGSLVPLAGLLIRASEGRLSANPVAAALNQLGLLTLTFLIATLAATPLRLLFGWSWPIRIRRMLGLFAFFYASLHFVTYVAIDQQFDFRAILEDILKRKFIFVGFTALVLLVPLALTSTNASVRRMGIQRWQRLHRLAYVAAALGVIHFVWRVKRDLTQPALYGAVLALLLLIRAVNAWRARGTKRAGREARNAPAAVPSGTDAQQPGGA
jgi:methionine sulfoxide reductase heme-binding subunit